MDTFSDNNEEVKEEEAEAEEAEEQKVGDEGRVKNKKED